MITVRPSDAIRERLHKSASRYYMPQEWFLVYEHFARLCLEWSPEADRCEVLNGTSSVHNRTFAAMGSLDRPVACLAALFLGVGGERDKGSFLRYCRIRKWADLDRPIRVRGWRPRRFAASGWFDLGGRVFRQPGPNQCHPEARTVYGGVVQFCEWRKTWDFGLRYGYPHGSSVWTVGLQQGRRESLDRFARRVDAWLEEKLEPDPGPDLRRSQAKLWSRVSQAYEDLFWDGLDTRTRRRLADTLVGVPGGSLSEGRIELTRSRARTLLRWARDTTAKAKEN